MEKELSDKLVIDKKAADALCSIILLGYSRCIQKESKFGKPAIFTYEKDEDKEDYQKVMQKFETLGVTIVIMKSDLKPTNAVIIAETARTQYYNDKTLISDVENSINNELERLTSESLYGAYIGGRSEISKVILNGASILEMYKPKYREALDISDSYERAKRTSNEVIKILKTYQRKIKPNKKDQILFDLNNPITQDYEKGMLFRSVHGMVNTMILYSCVDGKNAFNFELAYSQGTKKVSSCFPCCAFMTAQGTPPSSVHLGRGDNWNFPEKGDNNSRFIKEWSSKIITYYKNGLDILKQKNLKTSWNENFPDTAIPSVFLEALTFEGSFTDKVINTNF